MLNIVSSTLLCALVATTPEFEARITRIAQFIYLAEHVVPNFYAHVRVNQEMLTGAMKSIHIEEREFGPDGLYYSDAGDAAIVFRTSFDQNKDRACFVAWHELGPDGLGLLQR